MNDHKTDMYNEIAYPNANIHCEMVNQIYQDTIASARGMECKED